MRTGLLGLLIVAVSSLETELHGYDMFFGAVIGVGLLLAIAQDFKELGQPK